MRLCMAQVLEHRQLLLHECYRGYYQFSLDRLVENMRLSLWIKFCGVFIGSIFLTGYLLSQNEMSEYSGEYQVPIYIVQAIALSGR